MANAYFPPFGVAVGSFDNDTTQKYPFGTVFRTRDGRVFRYCGVASGSALVAGNVIQGPATVANHLAVAVQAAAAVGATSVSVTLGGTSATANQYAEGYLGIDTTPGNGLIYCIDSHPAANSSATLALKLRVDEAIQVALTTSSVANLIPNPYNGVIQCPTALTGIPVGVAPLAISASNFGWLQTWGMASVLINGTPALGREVVPGATTAGSVDIASSTFGVIGYMAETGVSTHNNMVYLTIAP